MDLKQAKKQTKSSFCCGHLLGRPRFQPAHLCLTWEPKAVGQTWTEPREASFLTVWLGVRKVSLIWWRNHGELRHYLRNPGSDNPDVDKHGPGQQTLWCLRGGFLGIWRYPQLRKQKHFRPRGELSDPLTSLCVYSKHTSILTRFISTDQSYLNIPADNGGRGGCYEIKKTAGWSWKSTPAPRMKHQPKAQWEICHSCIFLDILHFFFATAKVNSSVATERKQVV